MIRDQIVDACRSTELRRKFLAAQDLTLEKVQKIGRTYELAVMHSEKNWNNQMKGILKMKQKVNYRRKADNNLNQEERQNP